MGEHDGRRERLRERFLKTGLDSMQDHEVLELLLFYAIPRKDTSILARSMLNRFGTLAAVLDAPPEELQTIDGISKNTAVLLHLVAPLARRYQLSRSDQGVCLTTTEACGEYLLPYFIGSLEEMVYLLCLDAKCKVLTCRLLQIGSVNNASISLRKAAEIAISCKATSVVLAHNHTSGLALPSRADIDTTLQLKHALEPLGILLVDHIVVTDNDFVSMADNGIL